jgi:hypothetical protein
VSTLTAVPGAAIPGLFVPGLPFAGGTVVPAVNATSSPTVTMTDTSAPTVTQPVTSSASVSGG